MFISSYYSYTISLSSVPITIAHNPVLVPRAPIDERRKASERRQDALSEDPLYYRVCRIQNLTKCNGILGMVPRHGP